MCNTGEINLVIAREAGKILMHTSEVPIYKRSPIAQTQHIHIYVYIIHNTACRHTKSHLTYTNTHGLTYTSFNDYHFHI